MSNTNTSVWTAALVEKLIKRMNNELKLQYSDPVLGQFSEALLNYSNSSNAKIREIYTNPVLDDVIKHSGQHKTPKP